MEKDIAKVSPSKKAYEQVADAIRKMIVSGKVGADGLVGSEISLAQENGVSRVTVRRAVDDLIAERLLQRRPGKGLYVRKNEADRIKNIWFVIDNIGRESFVQFFRAAQKTARDFNLEIHLKDGMSDTRENLRLLAELARRKDVDGAIIVEWHKPEFYDAVQDIKKRGIPFVVLDHYNDQTSFPCVVADNYRGGWLAAEHLHKLGHRQFAFIGNTRAMTVQKRIAGFRDFLAEKGIALPASQIMNIDPTDYFHEWEKMVDEALAAHFLTSGGKPKPRGKSSGVFPTALFASSDRTAQEVYQWCLKHGISIPNDLSVVGFDNEPLSRILNLTTVAQPFSEMGAKAMCLLNEQFEGAGWNGKDAVLPVSLVVRGSTAKAGV
jgi:GntR family transcriptional regulator of arabinose operon